MIAHFEYISLYIRMKPINIILYFLGLTLLVLIYGCAQQGAPTGGPRDEDPPVVLKSTPENYSTNFNAKKITITFDEYLDMGNFTQELVVSPPMEEKPEIRLRNKQLIIEFEEELIEEITYTFNFGEGIKDLNERNILLNYEFVFATGDYLDSLSVKGTLKNAFDLSIPETPINVMLYREFEDSIPLKQIPYYVGRTDKEGNFAVNNLQDGVYKMFVLTDGNNNFLFDLPDEKIAFLDSSLTVDAELFRKILLNSGVYDSTDLQMKPLVLDIDTAGMSLDSVQILLDSLEQAKPDFNSLYVDLYMFTEDSKNQFLSEFNRDDKRKIELLFNLPLTDSFAFQPVFPDTLSMDDLISEFGQNRDSLTIWMGDTVVADLDTVQLSLQYTIYDSIDNPVSQMDTILFSFRERTKKGKKDDNKEVKKEFLQISTIRNRAKHDIRRDLNFTINEPLRSLEPELFNLFIIPDSIEVPIEVKPFIDSTHLRRAKISHPWKEEGKYRIVLYPGAMTNIYGVTNDTTDLTFQIRPLAEYGKINLSLENVSDTLIIQLFKKDLITSSLEVPTSGTYVFDFINPGTYHIKIVHDRNRNGKWDTGNYLKGLQPEKVEFVPRELKIRANWDHDIAYIIGTNNKPPLSPEKEEKEEKGNRENRDSRDNRDNRDLRDIRDNRDNRQKLLF